MIKTRIILDEQRLGYPPEGCYAELYRDLEMPWMLRKFSIDVGTIKWQHTEVTGIIDVCAEPLNGSVPEYNMETGITYLYADWSLNCEPDPKDSDDAKHILEHLLSTGWRWRPKEEPPFGQNGGKQ